MPSSKPTQPPAFDAATTWKVLDTELRKDDGSGYQVFQDKAFPRWKRWVDGTAEFDGTGLRDVVNANAIHLDAVEENLNAHKAADASGHQTINQRLAALEAQSQTSPFPASSSPGGSSSGSGTGT